MPAHNEGLNLMDVFWKSRLSLLLQCAGAVMFAVSLTAAPMKEANTWQVEIEALGQANPSSHGNEVWVYEVRTPQEVLDWKNIKQTGAQRWEFRPRPNASGGQAALATGSGRRAFEAVLHGDYLTVKMIKHAWSGRVKITVNGVPRILDLYSAAEPALISESFGADSQIQPPIKVADASVRNTRPFLLATGILFICLVIWTIWRRSGDAGPVRENQQEKFWLDRAAYRVLISGLIAIPVSPILARVIFGAPGERLGFLEFTLAFVYSLGLLFGILTVWRSCRSPAAPGRDNVMEPGGRRYWGVAMGVSAIAATIIITVGENSLNKQHAYWVKVLVETAASQPPPLTIRYGNAPNEVQTLQWQPASQTILSIARLSAPASTVPIQVDELTGNGKPIGDDDIAVHGGIRYHHVVTLAAPAGGMLRWLGATRQLTFNVSGGPELIRIYWLDQAKDIEIGPVPQVVSFDLGGSYQGWALLPPSEIDSLSIESSGAPVGTYLVAGYVFAHPEQEIRLNHVQLAGVSRIPWPHFKSINVRRPATFMVAWLCIFAGGMLASIGFFRVSLYLQQAPWFLHLTHLFSSTRIQPDHEIARFLRIALPIWIICVVYHLVFVFSVAVGFTNDSVGYYDMAQQFVAAPYLQAIVVERTPGYPLFIAAVIWIFGATVWVIALLQHLVLASLSLVTIWCLWDRLPRKWAATAGLLAGMAPAVTPMANLLWTETLYCSFACSALLFALCYRRRSVYILLAGLCAGAATMLRPNGLLLLLAIGGCLLLHFFWQCGRHSLRPYVSAVLLLTGGYLMVAAPWHMHLQVSRHTLALGKGLKEFGSWAGYVFQRQLPVDLAINRPDRAIYADPDAYHDEPYVAKAGFPLVTGDETVYYRETEREWFASQSWAPYLEDLEYNATLAWHPVDLRFEFREIRWFIEGWMQPDARVTASGSETQRLLSDLANRRLMSFQFTRMPCLEFSKFVLDHWFYIALFAGVGLLSCLVWPWPVPIAMFVVASVLAFSTNLVPGERYIAVLEPLYYVLSVEGAYALWTIAIALRNRTADVRNTKRQAY